MGAEKRSLRELVVKATRDRAFRAEFLKDPAGIGKKHGVSFTDEQLARIKDTAKFIESAKDIIITWRDWDKYPLPPVMVRWTVDEIYRAIDQMHIVYPPCWYPGPIPYVLPPPYYPMPPMMRHKRRLHRY